MRRRFAYVLVACLAATPFAGCSRSADRSAYGATEDSAVAKIHVELDAVTRGDVSATVELVGSLIAQRRSIIVSEVDAVIEEIPTSQHAQIEVEIDGRRVLQAPRLDLGLAVAEDDVLVRLDRAPFLLKLQAAQAKLNTAGRELENLRSWRRPEEIRRAEAARDEAAVNAELAALNLSRARELLGRKAMAQASYDTTYAAWRSAQAVLKRATADLELANAGPTAEEIAVGTAAIEQARAEVARAQWELEKTEIRAPYDGVVTDRFVDEGERVTAMPRVEIMELMDLSVLTAQLRVPERYVNQIHVGDAAEVCVRGCVDPVRGLVSLINDKVDPESRTFRIRVRIENDQCRFKVGQFVRVALKIDGASEALTIPAQAVTYRGGESRVFVCEDGRVRQKNVTLGLSDGTTAEVLSGLDEGQRVVVKDPSILSDGMSVEVRTAESQPQAPVDAS